MPKNSGLTLMELLISIVILTCLISGFMIFRQSFYQANKIQLVESELIQAIQYSRNMALIRGQSLLLKPLQDNDWSTGMGLFEDKMSSLEKQTMLKQWAWFPQIVKVQWHGFQSDRRIVFSDDLGQSTCNGQFIISAGEHVKVFKVNRLGRVKESNKS